MWKNMIFWLWEVQKGTSSLHREMKRISEKVAWCEEKLSITWLVHPFSYSRQAMGIHIDGIHVGPSFNQAGK
jgi:hypothetical protein